MQMYVHEHAYYPLLATVARISGREAKWYDDLLPYINERWTNEVFACPSYQGLVWDGRIDDLTIHLSGGSYGYNVGTADETDIQQFGLAGKFNGPGTMTQIAIPESDVQVPSDMIAIGDSVATLSQKRRLLLSGLETLSRRLYIGLDFDDPSKADEQLEEVRDRHKRTLNVSFSDGHTEAINYNKLYLDTSLSALRRWHSDNQPHSEFFR